MAQLRNVDQSGSNVPMSSLIVSKSDPIALIGGGQLFEQDRTDSNRHTQYVVAVDGGATSARRHGIAPNCVIGDLDSISAEDLAQFADSDIHPIKDQDTTDFDKALRSVDAPLIYAFGFTGKRLDHGLAAFHTLVQHPNKRCIIVGEDSIVCVCPPEFALDIPPTDAFSLFPMGPVTGTSLGLNWPIDGLAFSPMSQIGTSNAATGPVTLTMDRPNMLVIVPRHMLDAVSAALLTAAEWPVREK